MRVMCGPCACSVPADTYRCQWRFSKLLRSLAGWLCSLAVLLQAEVRRRTNTAAHSGDSAATTMTTMGYLVEHLALHKAQLNGSAAVAKPLPATEPEPEPEPGLHMQARPRSKFPCKVNSPE